MKITQVKSFLVNYGRRNWIFVKVSTDSGIEGVGECFNTLKDKATEEAVKYLAHWLIGADPLRIEHLWQTMYRFSRFPLGTIDMAALSGLEHALWDISGKHFGTPAYNLLGGTCRDKIRVYTHAGGRTADELAQSATEIVRAGYSALKFVPFPRNYPILSENELIEETVARVGAVREAVGDNIDICLDAHGMIFSPALAVKVAKAVEDYRPFFLEEPLLHDNMEAWSKFSAKVDVPLATGERLITRYGFRKVLEGQIVDIIQPDPCVCGGVLETKKIAAMAEAYYIQVAPHNPMGPVATAVCAHIDASTPNFLIQEYIPDDKPPRSEVVIEPLEVEDGYLKLPTKPGLGIELNEEAFEKYPYRPTYRDRAYREDGSVALT